MALSKVQTRQNNNGKGNSKATESFARLPLPMFHYLVHIIVASDIYWSAAKRGFNMNNAHAAAVHFYTDEGDSFIFLPRDATMELVAHESFHAVWRLFDWMGAEHNNEVMAYALGTVVGACDTVLERDFKKWGRPKTKR